MEEVQSDVAALHSQAAHRAAQHAEAPHQQSPRRAAGRHAGELDGAPITVDIGLIARCDFTDVVLRGEMLIDADRFAVYESLTEPEHHVRGARRTCASLLANLDVHPRVATQILRHAQFSITMEIHTVVSSAATRSALKKLGETLDH
jgi:hypothetical protein